MKKLSILLAMIAVCAQLEHAQSANVSIQPEGVTRVSAVLGKMKVESEFRTSKIEISRKGESEPNERHYPQCTYSRFPCSLTEQVHVRLEGDEVFIPRSAYADLGDINTARWSILKNGTVVLTVTGGDGSESYVAAFYFKSKDLVERRLYSGEDTSHPQEITRFYQLSDD